ncbi:hypothetical protein [Ochrobactrum sp. BTU1]|uniref:hypothetical protein n=1 Tax=Ochrobactrum sp. BTU1 TaxID=2840456 RepID=UPI001C050FE1|nr:hypothetical protein KMS41_25655 [Ochrobactrum sp. BTU1]
MALSEDYIREEIKRFLISELGDFWLGKTTCYSNNCDFGGSSSFFLRGLAPFMNGPVENELRGGGWMCPVKSTGGPADQRYHRDRVFAFDRECYE